jgi:hypothetical protein
MGSMEVASTFLVAGESHGLVHLGSKRPGKAGGALNGNRVCVASFFPSFSRGYHYIHKFTKLHFFKTNSTSNNLEKENLSIKLHVQS